MGAYAYIIRRVSRPNRTEGYLRVGSEGEVSIGEKNQATQFEAFVEATQELVWQVQHNPKLPPGVYVVTSLFPPSEEPTDSNDAESVQTMRDFK